MRSLKFNRNSLVICLFMIGVFGVSLLEDMLVLAAGLVVLGIVYYALNSHRLFWHFVFLIPLLPPFLAFKGGGLPFINGFRLMLVVFIFDQLVLKRRIPEFINAIKQDRFKIIVLIYGLCTFASGFYQFTIARDTGAFIGSLAILVEKILFYYLIIINVKIHVQKLGVKDFLKKFLHIICAGSFVLAFFGIIEFLTNYNVFQLLDISNSEDLKYKEYIRSGQIRVSSSFAHTLGYGLFLLIVIPISFYQLKMSQTKKIKFFYSILSLLLIVNLFMTLSRSVMLAGVICLVTSFFLVNFKQKLKLFLIAIYFLVPILLLSLSSYGNNILVISTIGTNIKALSDSFLGTSLVENFGANEEPFSYREQLIDYAFAVKGEESVFGKGIGFIETEPIEMYIPELNPFAPTVSKSVDNFYLLIKLEQGWIGLVATILLFVVVLLTMLRFKNNNPFNFFILIAFIGYIFELTMVADLDTIKYFWLFLGVYSVVHIHKEESPLVKPQQPIGFNLPSHLKQYKQEQKQKNAIQ